MRFAILAALLGGVAAHAATVTVPGDFPTVQAAIDGAADGAVIQVQAGRYHERLLVNGVTRALTVRGDPSTPANVVVDGDAGQDATLTVVSTGSGVVFDGFTVTGGTGHNGYGGGLFMADSDVIFQHCVFTGNTADPDGGGAFLLRAGGLFEDCDFTNNSAGRFGGGVSAIAGSTTVFQRVRFIGNVSGTVDAVNGWGGGAHVNDSYATFIGCTVQGNTSHFAAGGMAVTGHFASAKSSVTLRDTVLTGNSIIAASASNDTQGGGMHIENNVEVRLERVRVASNVANSGGGLSAYRADYLIVDSVVEDNQANAVTPDQLGGFGGGLYLISVNVTTPTERASTASLVRTLVRRNTAHEGAGIFVQGDFMLSANQATLQVADSLVSDNVASGRGAGIVADRSVLSVVGSAILSNRVTAGSGGWGGGLGAIQGSHTTIDRTTIAGNDGGSLGGAMYLDLGGTIDVTASRFYANHASNAAGLGGGAIAVGEQSGATPGPVTGTVATSIIADNGTNFEIWESNCNAGQWSTIVYQNNGMRESGGGIYYRNCTGATNTVSAFNAVGGKASGNVSQAPVFATFLAVPGTILPGAEAALAWTSPGSGLSIDGGVGGVPSPIGSTDVGPASSTTYALSRSGNGLATATVDVTCASLGTPVASQPRNRSTQPAGSVTFNWRPAEGATSYDLYLGASGQVLAVVAADLTGTTATVDGLVAGLDYEWQVVAKSPACASPSTSPPALFHTCASAMCDYVDFFNEDDLASWTRIGKGQAGVISGALSVRAKKNLSLLPPVPALGDATMTVSLGLLKGRREMALLFGYQDEKNCRGLVVSASSGRLRLEERRNGRLRRIKTGRAKIPVGKLVEVKVEVHGATAEVYINGAGALTGTFPRVQAGRLGIQVRSSLAAVDSIRVTAE